MEIATLGKVLYGIRIGKRIEMCISWIICIHLKLIQYHKPTLHACAC